MNDAVSMFLMVGGGLGMFLLGMKHLDLDAVQAESKTLHDRVDIGGERLKKLAK